MGTRSPAGGLRVTVQILGQQSGIVAPTDAVTDSVSRGAGLQEHMWLLMGCFGGGVVRRRRGTSDAVTSRDRPCFELDVQQP
jgi:hypothetical protein